jgi:hypothetical protein
MTIKKFAGVVCYQLVTITSAFYASPLHEPCLLLEISLTAEVSDVTTSLSENGENSSLMDTVGR